MTDQLVEALDTQLQAVDDRREELANEIDLLDTKHEQLTTFRESWTGQSTNGDKPAATAKHHTPRRAPSGEASEKKPRPNTTRREERLQEILGMLNSHDEISQPMARERLGLPNGTTGHLFEQLEREGAIVFVRKQGRAKIYAAPSSTSTPQADPPPEPVSPTVPVEESEVRVPEPQPSPSAGEDSIQPAAESATAPVSSDVEDLALQLLADRQYMATSLGLKLDLDHATTLGMLEGLAAAGKVTRRSDGYYEITTPPEPEPDPDRDAYLAELEPGILGQLAERSRSLSRLSNDLGATHTDVSEICERLSGEGVLDKLDDYTYTMAKPD